MTAKISSDSGLMMDSVISTTSTAGDSSRVAAIGPVNGSRMASKVLNRAIWAPTEARSVKPGDSDRIFCKVVEPNRYSMRPAR